MKTSTGRIVTCFTLLFTAFLPFMGRPVMSDDHGQPRRALGAATSESTNRSGSNRINTPIVYYLNRQCVKTLRAANHADAAELPDRLVIDPGNYSFASGAYHLDAQGLYRFVYPTERNAQRIVYVDDLDALLSALSWIATHGNLDDGRPTEELSRKALQSKLFITCGTFSRWACHLLTSRGVQARLVGGMTLDDWNTYNNAHALVEVWREEWGKWVLYDLDNNSYFTNDAGTPLNLLEFSAAVGRSAYSIVSIASDTRVDASGFSSADGYEFAFFCEATNANIRNWYARVMQIPMISDDLEKKDYFMDAGHRTQIESYSPERQFLEAAEFMKRFYGERD